MNLMKTSRTLAAIAFATLGFASSSQAAVTAVFSAGASCGGATSANFATSGPIVQVSLCATITAPTTACGHTIVLQSAAADSGRFNVTARALGANYPDPNSEVILTPLAINNPAAAADFGGTVQTQVPVAASANQLLATFDLAPQSTALNNSYVISLAPASILAVDADGTCGATSVPTEASLTASFTLNRILTPTFTSAAATTFALNAANTFNVTASGNAPITFSAGAGLPGTVTLSSAGVLSGTPTANGTFPVVITATGAGTVTQNFVLTVSGLATQTITFANPGSRSFSATPVALTASASSGLPVTFSSLTPFVCAVSGPSVTMTTTGTCTVAANQGGNATFSPAPVNSQSFGITATTPGAPTIGAAASGDGRATISFTAPTSTGGSAITGYTAACGSSIGTGASSPIVVSGLTNGTTYNCSVTATNLIGTGPSSATVTAMPSVGAALVLVGVQSRKTHGTAGAFDLPIDGLPAIGGNVTVEPRVIGAGHTIVFQFNNAVTAVGAVTAVDSTATAVGTATSTFAGSEVTVTLTAAAGVLDNKRVTINVATVNGTAVQPVSVGFLVGDVTNSRTVTGADVLQVKGRSGLTVDGTNFIYDVTVNGTITGADILQVKGRSGLALAP